MEDKFLKLGNKNKNMPEKYAWQKKVTYSL